MMTVQPLGSATASLLAGPSSSRLSASPSKQVRAQQLSRPSPSPTKKRKFTSSPAVKKRPAITSTSTTRRAPPQEICAFCLQTADRPKGDTPKLLISCCECGSSGHPSCLKWGRNPTKVRKALSYDWRCIECKKCEICRDKGDDVSFLPSARFADVSSVAARQYIAAADSISLERHDQDTDSFCCFALLTSSRRPSSCSATAATAAGISIACLLL